MFEKNGTWKNGRHGGLLDVTTNVYYKSCAYHPDSECCAFFHGNLSDSKSSEDTLLYLYVILNMLKSAGLHETILMLVICHDGVTLYFWMKFPSVARKKTRNGHFSIYQQISAHSKWKQRKKKRRNSRLNARKHWESEIIIATSLRYYYK